LATVDVAELAVDRRRDGRGDQVRRGDPRLHGQAVEVIGDGADRGRDDGLVERTEEHPHHQPGDDREDLPVGVLTRLGWRGGPCGGRWRLSWGGHRRPSYRLPRATVAPPPNPNGPVWRRPFRGTLLLDRAPHRAVRRTT